MVHPGPRRGPPEAPRGGRLLIFNKPRSPGGRKLFLIICRGPPGAEN